MRLTRKVATGATALVATGGLLLGTAMTAFAAGAPYSDPSAVGRLGFCDRSGHAITSGPLDAIPFVAKTVGTFRPPAMYDGAGRAAYLEAYQPRQGVLPSEWSGELLASSSTYSNPAQPAVAGTAGDISIGQFVSDFPAAWNGFVQLRMYYTAPSQPTYTYRYAAADLQVSGSTWRVVDPATLSCSGSDATSVAAQLAPRAAAGKVGYRAGSANHAARGHARQVSAGAVPPGTAASGGASLAGARTSAQARSSRGGTTSVALIILGGLAAAGALTTLFIRRRRPITALATSVSHVVPVRSAQPSALHRRTKGNFRR
ncbi:MAG: hypothetical protein JO222_02070 [Frankiales bacterium]|nr:hypothetical protein [Frankiales bacterium]